MSIESPLDAFLSNPSIFNLGTLQEFFNNRLNAPKEILGEKQTITLKGTDGRTLKDVVNWCLENDPSLEKVERAIDLMISSLQRARLMDLAEKLAKNS